MEKIQSRRYPSFDQRLFSLAAFLTLILMMDPRRSQWGAAQEPLLKYSPIILGIFAFILSVLLKPQLKLSKWQGMVLFLAMEMVIGGTYSVFAGSAPGNTWLGRGMIAIMFLVAIKIAENDLQVDLKTVIGGIYIAMIVIVWAFLFGLLPWSGLTQVYHAEAVFLFAAGWALFLHARRYRLFWFVCLVLMVTGLIRVGKYTTYVLLSVSLIINILLVLSRKLSRRMRSSLLTLMGIFALVALFFIGQEVAQARLEARAVTVRTATFEARIMDFQQHPLFGSFFVGDPILEFGPLKIPSHSDVLDLFSFGGIFAGILFFLPAGKTLVDSLKTYYLRDRLARFTNRWMVLFSLYFVTLFLIAMIVNPIIGVPYLGFWFWFCLGYLSVFVHKEGKYGRQSHR